MTVAVNTESSPLLKPLALIAGPTASGKSALAIALAKATDGTVINADASQVYRDLRTLSARPTVVEEAQVPHRLFGHFDGAQACSAAEWARDARAVIEDCGRKGRLPILVGGTGLYLHTLLDGIAPVPEIDSAIRQAVRAMPVAEAYHALAREDTDAAQRLHANDSTRIARALEVVRSTGKPIAAWQRGRVGGIGHAVRLIPAVLLPPRDWLYARCDARFSAMLANGAEDEVRVLLKRQLDPALPVMRAIGVREVAGMIAEPARRAEFESLGRIATRQYAKRQFTWFRNQSPIDWPRLESQLNDKIINEIVIKLRDTALTT